LVVTAISHPGIDHREPTFAPGTVSGHHQIPVIVESCRPEFLSAYAGTANHRDPLTTSHHSGGEVTGRQAAVGPPLLGDRQNLPLAGEVVQLIDSLDGLALRQIARQDDVLAL
jgi:hypothetical protein